VTLYKILLPIARVLVKSVGCRVEGAHNVPAEGSCIVASNHVTVCDPVFLACAMPGRVLHFMGKQSLFDIPVLGWLFAKCGGFPVSRGEGDVSAIRYSVSLLREGKVLAIFPEGTRSGTGELNKAFDGVGLIAEKSKAPVIPVRIMKVRGRKKGFRGRTRIMIGDPLYLEAMDMPENKRERRTYIAAAIMESISMLGG